MPGSESVVLYFTQGTSDKEYHVELGPKDQGYVVNIRYGKRGSKLTPGTKTDVPLPYEEAKLVYDGVVKKQKAKGYTTEESGQPFQASDNEERVSGILPQLLNPIDGERLEDLLRDDTYVAQEKIYGRRRLIRKGPAGLAGINRKGLTLKLPEPVAAEANKIEGYFTIDGELVDDVLYVFDLLELEGADRRDSGFLTRFRLLEELLRRFGLGGAGAIRIVPVAQHWRAKQELLARVRIQGGEGIVLKDWTAPYTPGRPASGGTQFKYPLRYMATFRVAACNSSKRSVMLELLNPEGNWVELGWVGIPANYTVPKPNVLCEVKYLHAYKGGSLAQPEYLGERDDLSEADAVLAQLRYKRELSEDSESDEG
jgi:bifunctional non-homologous end joining protein LigD